MNLHWYDKEKLNIIDGSYKDKNVKFVRVAKVDRDNFNYEEFYIPIMLEKDGSFNIKTVAKACNVGDFVLGSPDGKVYRRIRGKELFRIANDEDLAELYGAQLGRK